MPHVVATASECRAFTGGVYEFDVDADTVGRMIAALDARYPGLGDLIETRMAIAIDGEIHQNAWREPLRPDSEVYLIPRIGGG